jgi:hypothetical protein
MDAWRTVAGRHFASGFLEIGEAFPDIWAARANHRGQPAQMFATQLDP